jgi:putative ABC transport system permease protein
MQSSLRVMFRNKLRTLFMSIGVMLGVGTLIAGQALGSGAEQQLSERVNRIFSPGSIMLVSPKLTYADIEAIEDEMEQVVANSPRFGGGESEISYQGINRKAAVFGHAVEGEQVWNRSVTEGRYFNNSDMSRKARVALVGHRLADALFGDEADPLGKEIQIGNSPFRIIGVLESAGIDPHGEDRDEDIFIPITTAMRRLNNTEYIGIAKLLVSDVEQVDGDADQVAEIMREQHHIGPGEDEDFAIYSSKFVGRMVVKTNRVLNVYMVAAGGVVLLVAAIVIATIMLVVVRERVAEIGLRKALGATEQSIGLQFLAEVVTVTLVSGLLGAGLGIGAASLVSRFMGLPLIIEPVSVALGLVAAVTVGILSGIAPARKAARLDPVESLR